MQLTKKEAKYRKKLFAEKHMKKEQQKKWDAIVGDKGISYKFCYLINRIDKLVTRNIELSRENLVFGLHKAVNNIQERLDKGWYLK